MRVNVSSVHAFIDKCLSLLVCHQVASSQRASLAGYTRQVTLALPDIRAEL